MDVKEDSCFVKHTVDSDHSWAV